MIVKVAGSCIDGDCDCRQFDGLPATKDCMPPFHKECTCVVHITFAESKDADEDWDDEE